MIPLNSPLGADNELPNPDNTVWVGGSQKVKPTRKKPEGPKIPEWQEEGDFVSVQGKKYHIENKLGQGGVGSTYVVESPENPGEKIVLKVITLEKPNPTKGTTEDERVAKQRSAEQEVASLDQIKELVGAEKFDIGNRRHWLILTKYHPGEPLSQFMSKEENKNGIAPFIACTIVLNAARQIQKHAKQGVLYTDSKPSNIILDPKTHEVRHCDWGESLFLDDDEAVRKLYAIHGITPDTAATEQVLHAKASLQSPTRTLGKMLLHMLTGKNPVLAIAENPAQRTQTETIEAIRTLYNEPGKHFQELNASKNDQPSIIAQATTWEGAAKYAGLHLREKLDDILHDDQQKRMTLDAFVELVENIVKQLSE